MAYLVTWKYTNHTWMDTNLQLQIVSECSQIAQFFHRAGLPIWFLQPWKTGPFLYNVLAVITPLDPADSLCISPHEPPFPVILHGYMNTQEKHNAIQSYSQKWLVFKDLFQDKSPSKDPEPKRHVALVASREPILS